jgi:hypothetical protein
MRSSLAARGRALDGLLRAGGWAGEYGSGLWAQPRKDRFSFFFSSEIILSAKVFPEKSRKTTYNSLYKYFIPLSLHILNPAETLLHFCFHYIKIQSINSETIYETYTYFFLKKIFFCWTN